MLKAKDIKKYFIDLKLFQPCSIKFDQKNIYFEDLHVKLIKQFL